MISTTNQYLKLVYQGFYRGKRENQIFTLVGVFIFGLFGVALINSISFTRDLYLHNQRMVMGESVEYRELSNDNSYSDGLFGDYKVLRGYSKGEINESLVDSFYLSWPVKGGEGIVTQCFDEDHPAVDIADYRSPKILAAADGSVILADCFTEDCPDVGEAGGEGLAHTVMIQHENGFITVYGHLKSISVAEGDKVLRGDQIGVMGKSGEVDIISDDGQGIHLHFALIKDKSWNYLDPSKFLLNEICKEGNVDPEALFGLDESDEALEEIENMILPIPEKEIEIADEEVEVDEAVKEEPSEELPVGEENSDAEEVISP